MKKIAVFLIVLVFMLSIACFAQGAGERDGSSIEKAIIIKYVGNYEKSIDQEYQYLNAKYGERGEGWQLNLQSLVNEKGRDYDKMDIVILASGEEKTLYFDITEPVSEFMKEFE